MKTEWTNTSVNLDALGPRESKLWKECEPKIRALLEELKHNGKIESIHVKREAERLYEVLEKLDTLAQTQNILNRIVKPHNSKRFVDANSQFGITGQVFENLWFSTQLLLAMFTTEGFKLLVLFHLKNVNHAVSKFLETMSRAAPIAFAELKPYLDIPFRNAVAHGTFSIRRQKVVIFDGARLNPLDEMSLVKFMIRIKRQNILYICLFQTLLELKKRNWFADAP